MLLIIQLKLTASSNLNTPCCYMNDPHILLAASSNALSLSIIVLHCIPEVVSNTFQARCLPRHRHVIDMQSTRHCHVIGTSLTHISDPRFLITMTS